MYNLEMVFLGTHTFTFTLPSTAEVDVPGFEAVCTFQRLYELQAADEPAFTYAQAVCVSEVEDYDFRGEDSACVLVSHEAVRWVLCFPVGKRDGEYVPQTQSVPPDGVDIFYTFSSTAPSGAPIHPVLHLDDLRLLSPQPGDKLVVVRASHWCLDEHQDTVLILSEDVLEVEIIPASEVRVL